MREFQLNKKYNVGFSYDRKYKEWVAEFTLDEFQELCKELKLKLIER